MHIIHFMETFWPLIGGREVLIEKLTQALQAQGHELIIITGIHEPGMPEQETRGGVSIYRFPFRQTLVSKDVKAIGQILQQLTSLTRQFQPDVVHLHDIGPVRFFCLRSRRAKPARLLVTIHGFLEDMPQQHRLMLSQTMRSADWVTAVCNTALARLRELVPDVNSHSSVICNGYEPPAIEPLPLPFDPPQVLCLGRFGPEKRFDLAVSAFAELRKSFAGVQLTMAGDGPLRAQLQQQCEMLGLGDSVRFVGMVPTESIWDLLNQATMVVLPSRTEGLPLVALEASLMQRPVIASRVGGLPELVRHGQTGLLCTPQDVESLTQAMSDAILLPKKTQAMGAAARKHVLENFGWQSFVGQYEQLYREMIADIN